VRLEEGLAALMSWLKSEGAVPAPSA
jgi:hypothetical protein